MSVDSIFSGMALANGDRVHNQRTFTEYYTGYGFFGQLTELTANEMYTVKLANAGTLSLSGTPVVFPKAATLNDGWTWLPMPFQTTMALGEFMPSFAYQGGDEVKGQSQFAEYYDGFGWFGSLSVAEPGKGYKTKVSIGGSATFASARRQLEQVDDKMP